LPLLAIETSGLGISVALADQEAILCRADVLTRAAASELLVSLIDDLMARTGNSGDAIDRIAVCRGPGSFTGIRIGLATARALSLGWSCPVVSVTAFEATVAQLADYPGGVSVLLDARRGQIYSQMFGSPQNEVGGARRVTSDAAVIDPPDLAKLERPVDGGTIAVVGSALNRYEAEIRAAFPNATLMKAPAGPDAAGVAAAVEQGWASADLTSLYIRPPDARLPKSAAPVRDADR